MQEFKNWNEISQNLPEEEDIQEEAAENARQDLLSILSIVRWVL